MIELKSPDKKSNSENKTFRALKSPNHKRRKSHFMSSNKMTHGNKFSRSNQNTPLKKEIEPKDYRSDIKRNKNTLIHILESNRRRPSHSNKFRQLMNPGPEKVIFE